MGITQPVGQWSQLLKPRSRKPRDSIGNLQLLGKYVYSVTEWQVDSEGCLQSLDESLH